MKGDTKRRKYGNFGYNSLALLYLALQWKCANHRWNTVYTPHWNEKLSCRRGTVRRAMLVNSCYVSQGMEVRKVYNGKSDLQRHSRALAMVPFDRPRAIS